MLFLAFDGLDPRFTRGGPPLGLHLYSDRSRRNRYAPFEIQSRHQRAANRMPSAMSPAPTSRSSFVQSCANASNPQYTHMNVMARPTAKCSRPCFNSPYRALAQPSSSAARQRWPPA